MFTCRHILFVIFFAVVGFFLYKFRDECLLLVTHVSNNVYISHLNNDDSQAISKFIDKYKKALKESGKYSTSTIDQALYDAQKLLKQKKLVISVGYNFMGSLIGCLAVDLKTGFSVFYYIRFTDTEFLKIYKILLKDIELLCKTKGLKTLIIPILPPQIYYEDIFSSKINDEFQSKKIEESMIMVLQKLGYEPLEGYAKLKQGFKALFLGTYQYEVALFKNL